MVADFKARDELRASETYRNEHSSEAAVLGVLDAVGAADFLLACFLMIVCDRCASEVCSKVWQLPLQLSQLRQQPLHKSRPTSIAHYLHSIAFWVVTLSCLIFEICGCYKVLGFVAFVSSACCLPDYKTAVL